jgi:hypothetical protein
MKHVGQELTLTNMLADPMVRTVMAADRVDPQKLAAMLAGIAQTVSYSAASRSGGLAQRSAAESSAAFASTQVPPPDCSTRFQNGALVLR